MATRNLTEDPGAFRTLGTPESLGQFRITEKNPQVDRRWEAFVAAHPQGSIYHHPLWIEALEREYGQKGLYLICEDEESQILGVLPMLYTRGLPLNLWKSLTGRRLSSLPRTPLAGPLSVDSRVSAALLKEAVRRASQGSGAQVQIKVQERELDGLVDGVVCKPWRLSYILSLPAASTGDFRIAHSHSRSVVKWALNKAKKLGVYAREAENESDLAAWYRLYLETSRHNVLPPRPYRFFRALWELMRPRDMMRLLLAEQEVNGQRRIIAGSIFLQFGKTVSYAFNGSRVADLSLRPNDVIQWQAINDACKSGARVFDFGEVPEGNDDLAKFKKKWGAEPVRLHRYYHPALPTVGNGASESGGYPTMLGGALWRRLPLHTISFLGDRIYSYL